MGGRWTTDDGPRMTASANDCYGRTTALEWGRGSLHQKCRLELPALRMSCATEVKYDVESKEGRVLMLAATVGR